VGVGNSSQSFGSLAANEPEFAKDAPVTGQFKGALSYTGSL